MSGPVDLRANLVAAQKRLIDDALADNAALRARLALTDAVVAAAREWQEAEDAFSASLSDEGRSGSPREAAEFRCELARFQMRKHLAALDAALAGEKAGG